MRQNPESVQPSAEDPARIIVTLEDGMRVVLQKQKARHSLKEEYFPVTVLPPIINKY
jgi:hypothetical protein